MEITYNSIKPFYPLAIDYLVRTLLLSVLAFISGALLFIGVPNLPGKAAFYSWLIFIIVRLIILFVIKLGEMRKVGVGIDEKNLVLVSGLFSSKKVNIPIEYINNYSFNQSFFQKIFNVGNLEIVSREVTTNTPSIDAATAEEAIKEIKKIKGN